MKPILIVGPCAAESAQQVKSTAEELQQELTVVGMAPTFFRAGVWKPRSNPDSFSGVGEEALPWLSNVQESLGLPVCTEVMSPRQVEQCEKAGIMAIWIGARLSVNPTEVQQIADAVRGKPFTVLVKNPIVPDIKLWAGNVERFLKADVLHVMAVHRGFADSQENVYRNAPHWEIPIDLKVRYPELPILCDPSHLCGQTRLIAQVAQLALIYGFDGLMIESHCRPSCALSDVHQQLTPKECAQMLHQLSFKENTPNRELMVQRALLENVDTQLSELLTKRMHIVDEIAHIKRQNNLAVVQPQQWQQVRERYLHKDQDTLYEEFIEQFLELLHQNSIKRQQ